MSEKVWTRADLAEVFALAEAAADVAVARSAAIDWDVFVLARVRFELLGAATREEGES